MTFDDWFLIASKERIPTLLEAWNAGYRSFCDEVCEKCGQTRQQAGGGCIHCITEWCKDRVKSAGAECNKFKSMFDAINADFSGLEAERDELLADAMRYRWLKIHGLQHAWISLGTDCDGENFVDCKCEFRVPEPINLPYEDDEGLEWDDKDFDAAIDAAIAKGENNA